MNNKEFKELLVEWNNFVSGEEKEVIQEFKVKDALIAGVILAGGFAGIKAVNSYLASKGEKPAVTSVDANRIKGQLKATASGNNTLDSGLRAHLMWAQKNPGKATAELVKANLEGPASLDGSSVEELEEESDKNPVAEVFAELIVSGAGSGEVSVEDAEGNSRTVDREKFEASQAASEVSGIPLESEEDFLDWQDELLDGDDTCLEELADYILDGGGLDTESMSADDLFDAIGDDGKSGGEDEIMRFVNRNGNSVVKNVLNALLTAKSQGKFLSKERAKNFDVESLEDLLNSEEEVELFVNILQKIQDKV